MKEQLEKKSLLISIMSLTLMTSIINALYYQFIMTVPKSGDVFTNVLIQVVLMLIGFTAFNNQYKLLAISFVSYFTFSTVYQTYTSLRDYVEVVELYTPNELILPLVLTLAKLLLSIWICVSGYMIVKKDDNWIKTKK